MKKIYIDDNALVVFDTVGEYVEFSERRVDCWYDEGYLAQDIVELSHRGRPSHRYDINNTVDEYGVTFTQETFRNFAYDFLGDNPASDSGGGGTEGESVNDLFDIEVDDEGQITKTKSKYEFQGLPIDIGESIKITDLAQEPTYTTKFDSKQYLMMGYEFDESGSNMPLVKQFGESTSFDLQPLDDITQSFDTPVLFNITSQQDVIGETYTLKLDASSDVRLEVFRQAENGGQRARLVDEVFPQSDLSLDGFSFKLNPIVDFVIGKVYTLQFTATSGQIQVKGTELAVGSTYGVSKASNTEFFPYVRRERGYVYVSRDLTHLNYENKRVSLEPYSNQFNKLVILREYHKKRIIVSDGSKKIESLLPVLTPDDDGWTCQIVNLTPKMISVGGYKFKNGGSITLAYLGEEDKFIHLAFEANGGLLTNPDLIEIKDVPEQTYDIIEEDDGILINMQYNGNWVANLPDIDSIDEGFVVSIIHKQDDNFIGDIVAYSGNTIDGESDVKMYGQGLITLRKVLFGGSYEWFVFNQVSYNTVDMQGKSRILNFTNSTTITKVHNLGFIPIVQVWVEDGDGDYIQSNAQITHNWITRNEFTVELSTAQSGKILY